MSLTTPGRRISTSVGDTMPAANPWAAAACALAGCALPGSRGHQRRTQPQARGVHGHAEQGEHARRHDDQRDRPERGNLSYLFPDAPR